LARTKPTFITRRDHVQARGASAQHDQLTGSGGWAIS
jgi:hypothetical protein